AGPAAPAPPRRVARRQSIEYDEPYRASISNAAMITRDAWRTGLRPHLIFPKRRGRGTTAGHRPNRTYPYYAPCTGPTPGILPSYRLRGRAVKHLTPPAQVRGRPGA